MAIVATLVLGADGSSSIHGNSLGISSSVDRERFLVRRRLSDCLVIGGRTASSDRYQKTPVPLVVLSHSRPDVIDINPKAHWWNLSPAEAVHRAKREFGDRILIEAGVSIISELLDIGMIDQLELSVTQVSGGENRIATEDLLRHFKVVNESQVDDTTFYSCSEPIRTPK
ncbi:MAG TPA: dihydrofolate reductase family protein [Candidatus Nanopelagicaceae bacterium]